jgi:hypothetical protein
VAALSLKAFAPHDFDEVAGRSRRDMFDGSDDATAREILGMARRMSGLELALAVRLSLLAAMLRIVAEAIEDGREDDNEQ